ncbi:reverse transcriptase [Phytophthora megakarya]|uniref:Reverse transcriptase n=1 Tax=Phytophthora megakarya TaxID=4795 RepID=A0A225W3W7_9STRA|nr:reverse transcriptase [Phytophthora megakarya]
MSFGLENAPQIYQSIIDNALYGFTRIPKSEGNGITLDVLENGTGKPSVIGRSSCIDDILIPANSWDQLYDRVEIFSKQYLDHKVSHNGREAIPKGLSTLTDLAFPGSLRAMQSVLGSLNYYIRCIEDHVSYERLNSLR